MSHEPRQFALGDILSVTTGRLVSGRHRDGLYAILNHMTGADLFTHQLPRALEQCAPPLVALYPALAKDRLQGALAELDLALAASADPAQTVETWVATLANRYGTALPVPALSFSEHYGTPIADALAMMGGDASRVAIVHLERAPDEADTPSRQRS